MANFTIDVSDTQFEPLKRWKAEYDASSGQDPTTNAEFVQIAWDEMAEAMSRRRSRQELRQQAAKFKTLTDAEQTQVVTLIDTLSTN